jgi:cysteine desulfurase/selenocysteine lyase
LGPAKAENRVPVFTFAVKGIGASEVQRALDAHDIGVRAGDLAALPLLKRFGVTSATRASCYLYTSTGDIDRLAAALGALAQH